MSTVAHVVTFLQNTPYATMRAFRLDFQDITSACHACRSSFYSLIFDLLACVTDHTCWQICWFRGVRLSSPIGFQNARAWKWDFVRRGSPLWFVRVTAYMLTYKFIVWLNACFLRNSRVFVIKHLTSLHTFSHFWGLLLNCVLLCHRQRAHWVNEYCSNKYR